MVPSNSWARPRLCGISKKAEARAVLDELNQLAGQQYVPANCMALVYAALGEKNQAFAWLEKAFEEHSFQMQWLKVEPRWDSLHSDTRFADLTRRIGLPQQTGLELNRQANRLWTNV